MKILLIGCGKMGGAMLSAWLNSGIISHASIVDRRPNDTAQLFAAHTGKVEVYADASALPVGLSVDCVILAIKPQQMGSLLADLASRLQPDWPVLTIAAGLRIAFYQQYLPDNPIIRLMPNTPALLAKGMTVGIAIGLPDTLKAQVEKLLFSIGDFLWLQNEDQLDAAMAISGSGPAYFFYLAEQLAKIGTVHGLSEEQTMRLARQTLIGAGAIAEQQTDKPLEELRQNVTSPGGVTAASIAAWDKDFIFRNMVASGITANIRRAKELAKA